MSNRHRTRLALLALLALSSSTSAACAADVAETPGELDVELGTGSWRFEPIADGEELELVRGAQGGWHVWLGLQAQGLEGAAVEPDDRVLVTVESQPVDEATRAQRADVTLRFDPPKPDGSRSLVGYTHIFDDPSCAVGQMQRVAVTVTDGLGRTSTDERTIVPLGGTYPPPPCGETR